MEVEALSLETRGLWLDEVKPAEGYGCHFQMPRTIDGGDFGEIGFSERPGAKAVTARGIVKAASWSDFTATASATVCAAGSKASPAATVCAAGSKASPAATVYAAGSKPAPAEVYAAGSKPAPAEVYAAGGKVEEREEAKSAGAVKKKKKVRVLVKDEYINYLLADPPKPHRLRSVSEEALPFLSPAFLAALAEAADMADRWIKYDLDILDQYNKVGFAYEEIEVDEDKLGSAGFAYEEVEVVRTN